MTTENTTPAATTPQAMTPETTPATLGKLYNTVHSIARSEGFAAAVSRALPKHMDNNRFLQIVFTEINRNKTLQQCDVASFTNCVLEIAQMGLDCGKQEAHLIARRNKDGSYSCTKIVDYKGKVKLAFQTGLVEKIHADVIQSGDLFEYDLGCIVGHVPHFLRTDSAKPKDAGDVIASFAVVKLKDGGTSGAVVHRSDLDKIQSCSKSGQDGPYALWQNEMRKKAALHRAFKLIPLSPEFRDMMDKDDDYIAAETMDITPHPDARRVIAAHSDAVLFSTPETEFHPEA